MMSPEVIQALFWLVRYLLASLCGGIVVSHGLVAAADVQDFAGNTTTLLFGTLGLSGTLWWSWHSRRRAAIAARLAQSDQGRDLMASGLARSADGRSRLIDKVARLDEVHQIVADPATAQAQPSHKVVAPQAGGR